MLALLRRDEDYTLILRNTWGEYNFGLGLTTLISLIGLIGLVYGKVV